MEQQRSFTWVRRSPKVTDTRGSYLFKHVFYISDMAKKQIITMQGTEISLLTQDDEEILA